MRWILVIFLVCVMPSGYAGDSNSWPKISTGIFSGYGDKFTRIKGEYVLDNGCTSLGGEYRIQVTSKGIEFNGSFYPWDAPGFQASRHKNGEYERLNICGKVGAVVVIDVTTERPKGKEVSLFRMSLARTEK